MEGIGAGADVTAVRVRLESRSIKVRSRPSFVTPILAVILLIGIPSGALARAYLPPAHAIFQGVAGQPIAGYEQATGKHPAVYQVFSAWGQWLPAIFSDAQTAHARLMLHITSASGSSEMVTPGQIARGDGDTWLIALNQAIASSHVITYVRWMAEMDANWNPYSAFNADGSPRSADHSTSAYKAAWRRATLILRGGSRAGIDAALRGLRMPLAGRTARPSRHPCGESSRSPNHIRLRRM
jgi:hypothetical protein